MIQTVESMIGVPMPLGTTSSVTVRHLVDWLESNGQDLSAWRDEAGLAAADWGSPDLRVSLEAFDILWALAVDRDPGIGLRLIERFAPGQMHLVSHLAMRSATVGDAFTAMARYMPLTDPNDRLTVTVRKDDFVVEYSHPAMDDGRRHNPGFVEHLFSMGVVLLARAAGHLLPVRCVSLRAARLTNADDYRRRFGVFPVFEAPVNALVLDRGALDWPMSTRDDYLKALLEGLAAARLPVEPPSTPATRLADRLRRGWWEGRPLDMAHAAAAMGMSEGRLRARLAAEGTGFRALHDATRRDVARAHLAGPMAIGEIAFLLGFSEPAALHHAVRRWFGTSVGEYRARLADPSRRP